MSLRLGLVGLASVLLASACHTSSRPAASPARAVSLASSPAAGATSVDPQPGDFESARLVYLRDGYLAVLDAGSAHVHDGTRWHSRRVSAPNAIELQTEHAGDGELLQESTSERSAGYVSTKLLSPVDLHVLFEGLARPVDGALVLPTAARAADAPSRTTADGFVVIERGGRTVRIELAPGPKEERTVESVTTHDDVMVVSWRASDGELAQAFRISTGEPLAMAAPMFHRANDPVNLLHGTLQLYIGRVERMRAGRPVLAAGNPAPPPGTVYPRASLGFFEEPQLGPRALVVRDLIAGQTVRQREIPCPRDFLGHPMVSPDGALALVVCGATVHVLDAATLKERRRIQGVVGSCPSAPLEARVLAGSPALLQLRVCGAVARIDLATGLHVCGDDDVALGGPSEEQRGVVKSAWKRPDVPRCGASDEMELYPLGMTGAYGYDSATHRVLSAHAPPVQLEAGATGMVLSPAEDRVAYLADAKLHVRSLPAGQLLLPSAL